MGGSWAQGLEIDRIDNNKGYSRENCKWSTKLEQMNNRRICVFLEKDGKKLTISQWSRIVKIDIQTLTSRKNLGWTDRDILTKPIQRKHPKKI